MNPLVIENLQRQVLALCLLVLSSSGVSGYDVWLGLPYFPKGANTTLKDQWELTASILNGLNPNLSQNKLPAEERNTNEDWKKIIALMPKAKNDAMTPMPRAHFNYGTRTDKGTLPEYLVRTFRNESRFGYKNERVMPSDEQPNEERTKPVYNWTNAELQEMRDWLDSNGHADTRIIFYLRNIGIAGRNFVQKPLVGGYSIEARAKLGFEGTGNRPTFLQWAVRNSVTKAKCAKFQMPFGGYDDSAGDIGAPSNMTGCQAMRRCMRWLVTDVLGDDHSLFQRDDATFLSIVYDPTDSHFPKKSTDGSSEEGWDGDLEDPDDNDSPSLPGAGGEEGGGEGGIDAGAVGNRGNGLSPGGGGGGARTGRFVVSSGDDLQKTGGSGGLGRITISYLVLPNLTSNQEDWRMLHFGTTDNTGAAADNFDANSDGESNLLEYATGQTPHAVTLAFDPLKVTDDCIECRHRRSAAALAEGMNYQVKWSESLQGNSWVTDGVEDSLDLETLGSSEIENRLATVSFGEAGKRVLRLRVSLS